MKTYVCGHRNPDLDSVMSAMRDVVPEAGLEPARAFTAPRILSPLRLPFHHSGEGICGIISHP